MRPTARVAGAGLGARRARAAGRRVGMRGSHRGRRQRRGVVESVVAAFQDRLGVMVVERKRVATAEGVDVTKSSRCFARPRFSLLPHPAPRRRLSCAARVHPPRQYRVTEPTTSDWRTARHEPASSFCSHPTSGAPGARPPLARSAPQHRQQSPPDPASYVFCPVPHPSPAR